MSRFRRPPCQQVARGDTGSAATSVVVAVLVIVPLVAMLWVPSYNKKEPELLGFPFFYWYQLLWVFITGVLTVIAYLFVRRSDIDRRDERQSDRDRGERS